MMKLICGSGRVIPVDDSKIDFENEYVPCIDHATLITEGVHLKKVWIATCERDTRSYINKEDVGPLDFITEKIFDHEPTEEELIYFMCQMGCGIEDIVYVTPAFRLRSY